jgi:hypothetical protein
MIFISFSIEKNIILALIVPPCVPPNILDTHCCKWIWPIQALCVPRTKSRAPFSLLRSYQRISLSLRQLYPFRNKASFYGEELLATRPTPKLEGHHLSAAHDCLFNLFTATLHIGGCSSIHDLRMCHKNINKCNWTFSIRKNCCIKEKQRPSIGSSHISRNISSTLAA